MEITYNKRTETAHAPEHVEKLPKSLKENFLRFIKQEPGQNKRVDNKSVIRSESKPYTMRENVQISINQG